MFSIDIVWANSLFWKAPIKYKVGSTRPTNKLVILKLLPPIILKVEASIAEPIAKTPKNMHIFAFFGLSAFMTPIIPATILTKELTKLNTLPPNKSPILASLPRVSAKSPTPITAIVPATTPMTPPIIMIMLDTCNSLFF